jgi:hypothetical protein
LTALADLLFSPEEKFEGALGAMADTWSWQSLVGWVSPLLVVVLTFILPRLFQRELRRLQLVSETRVKRLEALEKAMSLAGKAKSELGVKITTDELQNELRRILHEFAGPIVLSREALEDWENDVPIRRFFITPRFSAPTKEARYIRGMQKIWFLGVIHVYVILYNANIVAYVIKRLQVGTRFSPLCNLGNFLSFMASRDF